MFENPSRGRQARNFATNVPKILDLKSSSEQIFSENRRWVPVSQSDVCIRHRNTPTLYDARYISKYFSYPLLQYAPLVCETLDFQFNYVLSLESEQKK